ncbi:carboxylesterase family protein, partial [Lactococcus lactis]|uniref:carboxylesterase family protein n=1 Tax=Lactococcus lactis TaxID=1358 RepID=UPI000ACEFEDA
NVLTDLVMQVSNNLISGSMNATIEYASGYYFSGPVDLTQRYFAELNGDKPTYFYRLSADSVSSVHSVISQTIQGTSHGDDIGYLFNIPIVFPLDPEHPFNVFRRSMVTLWANFAKHGNPTPDGSN